MRGIDIFRTSRNTGVALLAILGLLLGGTGRVALAQGGGAQRGGAQQPAYRSSIQVPDDSGGRNEVEEADGRGEREGAGETGEDEHDGAGAGAERAESARYQSLARVTADQARRAALARIPGTVTGVTLENENGNLVYGVNVRTTAGERDVKVDAGNGRVLQVEQDEQHD